MSQAPIGSPQQEQPEVLADDVSRQVRAVLSAPLGALYPSVAPSVA
jgi:hypothetical protein